METDIGEPIDYMPEQDDMSFQQQQQQHAPPSFYQHQPQQQQSVPLQYVEKIDFFSNIDKTTYIIMFIAFILGFFMGKTMQPVILRH